MNRLAAIAALLTLAACGVDGPPSAPAASGNTPGVRISGEAVVGVVTTL